MGLCSVDLDDLLAYTTDRQVVVRHRWLGLLYYSTLVAILGYVVVWEVVIQRGYARFQSLSGTTRATYKAAASPRPIDQLPYCTQSLAPQPEADQLPCVSWDSSLTTLTSEGALLVGTRVTRKLQRRNFSCHELAYGCSPWYTTANDTSSVFVGDVESATVVLQHSVTAASLLSTSVGQLDSFGERPASKLRGAGGAVDTVPCGTHGADDRCGTLQGGDLIHVGDLLKAAGVDLGTHSRSAARGKKPESIRSAGITLIVTVEYLAGLGTSGGSYSYDLNTSVIEAKREFFGAFDSTFDAKPSATRELFDVHGIQLLLQQQGGLNTFDLKTLILTFVSGMALVAVAKSIANIFLLYLAPRREDYRLFVVSTTPDFSPDTEEEAHALEQVLEEKRRKHAFRLSRPASSQSGNARSLLPEHTGPNGAALTSPRDAARSSQCI